MSGPHDEDIIAAIAEQLNINATEASVVLQAMLDVITEALMGDRSVILKGFGTFEVIKVRGDFDHRTRTRRRRMVMLSSSRQPNFRAGSHLLRAIDDGTAHNGDHPDDPTND